MACSGTSLAFELFGVLLKLIVAYMVDTFRAIYAAQNFVTVFTVTGYHTDHLQFSPHPIYLRSILISSIYA
jgi:hypothetical protein